MPVDKLTIEQFATRIKDKYPQYKDIDDTVLTNRMLEKYPVYRNRVNVPTVNAPVHQGPTDQKNPIDLQFKPMTDWMISTKPTQEQKQTVSVDDHTRNTADASTRVSAHLADIDKSVSNLIYDYKKDMEGRSKSIQLGINPKESMPVSAQVAAAQKLVEKPMVVTNDEVQQYKSEMQSNPGMVRNALDQKVKDLTKTNPTSANKLKSDIYRLDGRDRADNEKKIAKNVDKIDNGDLDYDVKRGILFKPHSNFFSGLALGYQQKKQAFEDYETWTKGSEASIISELNSRMKAQDPDDPVDIPVGKWAEGGMILGGQPLKPIVGGALATWLGTPLSGAAATSGISAHEMYKLAIGSGLPQNYAAIKRQNPAMPDYTAYTKAKDLTEKQATADAFTGAAMGFVGGETAFKPTNVVLTKAVKSSLKQIGQETAKKTFEGLGVGVIGGAGQIVKNIMAQKAGLPVSTTEGAGQQLMMGMGMTVGAAILAKSPKLLKPSTYTQLAHGLSKLPDHILNQEFNNLQEVGYINPDEMKQAQDAIRKQKELDASIPKNISEPDRLKIANKIKERSDLENDLETQDAAYHPALKEKIKKINEEIVGISKRSEIQDLVHKESEAGNLHESAAELFRNATDQELGSHMADIAKLGHDPSTEAVAIGAFGEKIVNKSKELFPKQEKTVDNNVSLNVDTIKELSNDELSRLKELYKKKYKESLSAGENEEFISLRKRQIEANRKNEINNPFTKTYENIINRGEKIVKGIYYKGLNHSVSISDDGDLVITKYNPETGKNEIIHDENYGTKDNALKEFEKYKDDIIDEINQKHDEALSELEKGAGKMPSAAKVGGVEVSEHGEDTKTAKGQENGVEPSKLSEDGKKEAKALGKYLAEKKISRVISSPVERATQTAHEAAAEAERISGKKVPVEENELFKTANIGEDEGKPEGTFKEREWMDGKYLPKGAETPESFTDRMEKAYEYTKKLPSDVHVVAHSKVMRALEALKQTDGKWTDETTELFLKNKENAIPERSTEAIPVDARTTSSQEMGSGVSGPEEPSVSQGGQQEGESESTQEKVGAYPGPITGDLPFGEDIGIAHEYRAMRAENIGEMGPIRGEYMTTKDFIQNGRRLIEEGADPQKVAEEFKRDKKIGVDELSVVRAEHERLARETNKAANTYGVDSAQDKAAKAAESKWYDEVVKPMLSVWNKLGVGSQGVTDVDTGTFTGIRRYFEQENGKSMTTQQTEHAKKLSEQVAKLKEQVEDLKAKLTEAIDKQFEQATGEKPKTVKEKIDQFSAWLRKGKLNRPDQFSAATPGSLVWDGAIEIMAKTLEASGSVFQAIADGIDHIRSSDWYKALNNEGKANAENSFRDYFKTDDIFTRFADKTDNKFSIEDAKDVWDYAKESYLNRGADFEEMINGVSKDLGLSNDQVRNAIATPKGTRTITNEMLTKMYHQRRAIQQATQWVKSAKIPGWVKAINFIPSLFFRFKTALHGTVGGGTHAGMNIFLPSRWASYWPSFIKQFKFIKPSEFEKGMQDLENDSQFMMWKRAGLAIEPNIQYDDYTTFDAFLNRIPGWKVISGMGDRGFAALKVMRLEQAKAEFSRLSMIERADPDVLKRIATVLNHGTGTSKVPLPEATGTIFFAPRLEASRWARLFVQPAKAIITFGNWKNASAADKVAAKLIARRSGEMIGMYTAALLANQGILMATGSKQRVNMLHPGDPDWLKFKIGGKNVDVSAGMISAIGFIGHMIRLSIEKESALHGKKRGDELIKTIGKYGRGKLSPFASTVYDFASQHDYDGNTLPFSKDKPLHKYAHHLDWEEYILHQQTPIFIAEGIKAATDEMKQRGMSRQDINTVMGGIFVGAMTGSTGTRITEAFGKKSQSSDERTMAHGN